MCVSIHEATLDRLAKPAQGRRETIDVLLYGCGSITWCRAGNAWISVALPIEKPFWDYSLEVVIILAYTIMSGGRFNEKNLLQNLSFLFITALGDWLLPLYLHVFGIGTWLAVVAHIFHLKEAENGHSGFCHGMFGSVDYSLGPVRNLCLRELGWRLYGIKLRKTFKRWEPSLSPTLG